MEVAKRALETPLARLLAASLFILAAKGGQGGLAADSTPKNTQRFPDLTVLGYVTPWNSRGTDLVEEYRGKFDIVCPVWYTVHADEGRADVYEVRGGPPSEDDVEWYKRLQQTSPSEEALRVAPRFMLDGWSQADYQALVFNQTRWHMLCGSIVQVVEKMHYDGAAFESGATYALVPPLSTLSESLRALDKVLVVVSPPIRKAIPGDTAAFEAHNDMILQSIASLARIADYVSIMTYDMTGPAGRESTRILPEGSPIQAAQQRGNVREPASNTNADWARENLDAFILASDPITANPELLNQQQLHFSPDSTTIFLAGFPLYGYTYPTVYIDEHTGQATQQRRTKDAVAILRGAGEPIAMVEIQELLKQRSPEISKADDGEFFFDWENEDGSWRTFMPTPQGISHALATSLDAFRRSRHSSGGVGIALWEVGQSSKELLSYL